MNLEINTTNDTNSTPALTYSSYFAKKYQDKKFDFPEMNDVSKTNCLDKNNYPQQQQVIHSCYDYNDFMNYNNSEHNRKKVKMSIDISYDDLESQTQNEPTKKQESPYNIKNINENLFSNNV